MLSKAVILELDNGGVFGIRLNDYLDKGYKISASSCNSKTWKAILVKEDKEQESE